LAAIQQSLAHLTEMFTAFQQQQQQPAGHNWLNQHEKPINNLFAVTRLVSKTIVSLFK
jgi:hypothetical protein